MCAHCGNNGCMGEGGGTGTTPGVRVEVSELTCIQTQAWGRLVPWELGMGMLEFGPSSL